MSKKVTKDKRDKIYTLGKDYKFINENEKEFFNYSSLFDYCDFRRHGYSNSEKIIDVLIKVGMFIEADIESLDYLWFRYSKLSVKINNRSEQKLIKEWKQEQRNIRNKIERICKGK